MANSFGNKSFMQPMRRLGVGFPETRAKMRSQDKNSTPKKKRKKGDQISFLT
jgi:hypothetical protein